jgi:glyoxylase-like metal-dependent hydrolase (beta-lactamase superfamily II)
MPKEILPHVYLIEVPLPRNPLKNLNSYLVQGPERNLLIDTGFNCEECYDALVSALKSLGVDMTKTDVFLTHMHSDHSGLASRVASPASKIYMSKKDIAFMYRIISPDGWEKLNGYLIHVGFSPDEIAQNKSANPLRQYAPSLDALYTGIEDGFSFEIGGYTLRAIETPGHSPGHMCLYAEKQQVLFCGDHIIFDISPNITSWRDEQIPLRLYMENLERVRKLEVTTTLSAHRRAMGDHKKRVDELLRHHRARLEEARKIVEAYPSSTAYEIASKMTWFSRSGWQNFTVAQNGFAVGEAAAHLEYLIAEAAIVQTMKNDRFVYESTTPKERNSSGLLILSVS